jgi:hypothetical protein
MTLSYEYVVLIVEFCELLQVQDAREFNAKGCSVPSDK